MSYEPPIPSEHASPTLTPLSYASAEIPRDPGSPWQAIWLRPRDVMRWALYTDPTKNVKGLIFAGAVASAISNVGERATTLTALAISFGISVLIGTALGYLLSYYVAPAILTTVGRWLGGTGDRVALRAALAYSSIPSIFGIAITVVALALLVVMLVVGEPPATSAANVTPLFLATIVLGLAQAVLGLWGLLILINCMAVAHRYSSWAALGTLLLIGVIVLAIIAAVVLPIVFLTR